MGNIKFRAWNKKAKRMFEVNDIDGLLQNTVVCCKHGDACECMEGIDGYEDEVEIVQYIGRKDKNGKDICEGDIVTQHPYCGSIRVVWDESRCGFIGKYHYENLLESSWADRIINAVKRENLEVIGNIYENPELL